MSTLIKSLLVMSPALLLAFGLNALQPTQALETTNGVPKYDAKAQLIHTCEKVIARNQPQVQ